MARAKMVSLFLVFAFSTGCFSFSVGSSSHDDDSFSDTVIESSEDLPGNEKMPFTLVVTQEVNDGKELHILGKVKARTAWDPRYVILRLSSLKDGNVVGMTHKSLRSLIATKIGNAVEPDALVNADEEAAFSLAVPSVDISDYQLVLLWGEEAEPYLDKDVPRIKSGDKPSQQSISPVTPRPGLKMRVHSIEVETLKGECSYPPCEVRFRLSAILQNEGVERIQSAKLGIGFVPSEMAGTHMVPEEEEPVDVPQLNLEPGASRPLKILLNQEMPEDIADTVHPVLRIISFE